MMVGAGRSSPTPPCTDVEGDADSFTAVNLVNPFPVLVGDQSRCGALMILVAMITVAEVATVGGTVADKQSQQICISAFVRLTGNILRFFFSESCSDWQNMSKNTSPKFFPRAD